ncbi:unnamed protein product [Ixodes pacificus]
MFFPLQTRVATGLLNHVMRLWPRHWPRATCCAAKLACGLASHCSRYQNQRLVRPFCFLCDGCQQKTRLSSLEVSGDTQVQRKSRKGQPESFKEEKFIRGR